MVTLRPFLWPAAFLAAVTAGFLGWRAVSHTAPAAAKVRAAKPAAAKPKPKSYYRVRAGDTLTAVAARTGVPLPRILELNPSLQPTSLFLGQRIRVR